MGRDGHDDGFSVKKEPSVLKKALAALFFGVSSFLIIVINKVVLTSYRFPSYLFVGLGQMVFTIIVINVLKVMAYVDFPSFQMDIAKKIFPLPLIYLGNMAFGLGGTQRISLPMFISLRKLSIFMALVGEMIIFGNKPTVKVKIAIGLMILGSFFAAGHDLSFDLVGYGLVMLNNFFTAANVICIKFKLDCKKSLGQVGVMYYNCMFTAPFLMAWVVLSGDLHEALNFDLWNHFGFCMAFIGSCTMGLVWMYSNIVCTAYNSPLTTTAIGPIKNTITTYIGMVIGGDYKFSWGNFIGLNTSLCGGLLYTWVTFIQKKKPDTPKENVLESQTEFTGTDEKTKEIEDHLKQ